MGETLASYLFSYGLFLVVGQHIIQQCQIGSIILNRVVLNPSNIAEKLFELRFLFNGKNCVS